MVKTRQWILSEKPTDMPVLEGSNPTFKLVDKDLPDPKDDEVLVKLLYLSNDPAQRGWINKYTTADRLYVPPVKEGEPMRARGLCEVVESRSSKWKKGDTVLGGINWSEYAVLPAKELQAAKDLPNGMSKTHYLGALGTTGLTGYFGLTEIGEATKDDIVVVSGAAGATGMMVVQVAKHIIGCKKVIGIAGSDEKCKWVESLGADVCLNYKKDSFQEEMKKHTPSPEGFANVFYDNVGGEMLDFMLTRMQKFGRIVCCGAISAYNTNPEDAYGIKNWFEVISMRLKCQGFIVLDFMDKFSQGIGALQKALGEGKLKIEDSEHVVKSTFEQIPETWMQLFSGANTGKLVTAVE